MSTSVSDLYGVNNPVTVNAIYEDGKQSIGVQDFLQLMIAEIQNQDFTEPVDSSQYITQLAQISAMQQMEQMTYYAQTSYATGLVGKTVTAASLSLGGKVDSVTGVVEKVGLSGDGYEIYVNGKAYTLSQIMSINSPAATAADEISSMEKSTPYLLKRGDESATVAWNAPESDNLDQYYFSVYYSESDEMDSVAQIEKNGTLVASLEGGDPLNADIEDLTPDTTYYVNVVISTEDGAKQAYQKLVFNTKP